MQFAAMPIQLRRALVPLLIAGAITGAYAFRHNLISRHAAANAIAPNPNLKLVEAQAPQEKPLPIENPPAINPAMVAGRATLNEMLAQIIANAIDSGRLNPAVITAEQLALFPQWLKDKIAALTSRRLADEGKHSAEDETVQPEESPKIPCPDPGKLPAEWNNEYNKLLLRQQGCQL